MDFRATAYLTGVHAMPDQVAAAMADVPRHEFVRDRDQSVAYVNRPLSIGHGQTISQPYIVALMTALLEPQPHFRVLEIGTGSGYQAAVLAELVDRVYTIEIVPELAASATARLARLGYDNVEVRAGDGNRGWPEHAPFDGIIVTAAGNVPPALVEQLAPGARLVIPVERALGEQELVVITRDDAGAVREQPVLPVRFVPLTGDN